MICLFSETMAAPSIFRAGSRRKPLKTVLRLAVQKLVTQILMQQPGSSVEPFFKDWTGQDVRLI